MRASSAGCSPRKIALDCPCDDKRFLAMCYDIFVIYTSYLLMILLSFIDAFYFTVHVPFRHLPNPCSLNASTPVSFRKPCASLCALAHFVPFRKVHVLTPSRLFSDLPQASAKYYTLPQYSAALPMSLHSSGTFRCTATRSIHGIYTLYLTRTFRALPVHSMTL